MTAQETMAQPIRRYPVPVDPDAWTDADHLAAICNLRAGEIEGLREDVQELKATLALVEVQS
jgi:hypothetical protein